MPPKKKIVDPGAKAKAAKAKKSAEDKTFGLKNKNKSKKVQQYVNQVQVSAGLQAKQDAEAKRLLAEKKAADAARAEALALFKPSIQQQKVPFGVDPKSIVCNFFKLGQCTKGKKCKFAHDLEAGRKTAKRDLYTDEKDEEKNQDTMDKWDEAKLRSVVLSKHGNLKTTTDIVCKYFIEAVENGKYGWFWVCPDGGDQCKYRHSLPQGFVLKTKEQKRLEKQALESQPKITLEDFIETERDKLPKTGLTPITLESFTKWKASHAQQKLDERNKEKRALTGREIVLKKFEDKFYNEEDDQEKGDEWDLSEFKKEIEEIDENIKDYGDGSAAFAKEQGV
ncbi:unnamed protein product [Kuraishia capsulata CBS 1993]|uniref:C3H1-type domain-containing protein n=1 Tax=Kuraishia capsulata CBS 1993 TaxID=1382522 RepID=W6MIA2_9ASCO|nr:uncharacterized protein KUCA_T00002140001 [Kuraishia capsulata CBS 1993]CDK26169.1 unnamed protein product [Kuraishia capsulata CBS 1993]